MRLYLLRAVYLLNFLALGIDVWPTIISHEGPWDPVRAVAFSFWAALSLLMAAGIRYPLQMLPLLFLQLLYTSIWLVLVALPEWSAGRTTTLITISVIVVIVDLIAIPWSYVFGDRWKPAPASS